MTRARLTSVRARLVLLVLIAVLPAVLLFAYHARNERRQEAERALERALLLARVVSTQQDDLIVAARHLLVALAELPPVRGRDARGCSNLFATMLKRYQRYVNIGATGPGGQVFCSAVHHERAVSLFDRLWFQRAVRSRGFTVGEYVVDRITGKASLVFAYPVVGAADQVLAVVYVSLDLAWLNQVMTSLPLPDGAVLTVVDRTGTVLARDPDHQRWVGQPAPETAIIPAMLSGDEGTARALGSDGVEQLYAFAPLDRGGKSGAYVSVAMPAALAFADAERTLRRNLLGLGLATGATLVLAWVGGSVFVLRRVQALVQTARRLRDGDLAARTGLPPGDGELGLLGQAFDDMAEALEQRTRAQTCAEAALRESEARYRSLVENSGDAILLTAPDGKVVAVNAAACDLFGMTEGEIRRTGRDGLVDAADARLAATLADRGRTGSTRALLRLRRKDGTTFEAEVSSTVFRDPHDTPRTSMIIRDFTERTRIEEELRASERRLRETVDTLEQRTRQLEAVRAIMAEITRELDTAALLARITQHALALVGAQSGSVYLWDAMAGLLVPQTWQGLGDWSSEVRHRLGEGVAGAVAQQRAGLIVNDYRGSPYAVPLFLERTTVTAVIGEPLLYGDRLLGAIVVGRLHPGAPFTEDDRTLLQLFASHAAITLENAQRFTDRARAARETRSLYEVAHALTTSLDADEVLGLIAAKTKEFLGTPHAQVVLWDEATQSLGLGAACGTEAVDVRMQVFRLGSGVNGIVAQTRAPLVVNDYQAFPHRVPGMTKVVAVIGVPLLYRNRFLGVLTSHATAAGWTFTDDQLALLTSFADQAAVALENARLFRAEQQRREELEATRAVTEEIARELDLTALLRLINTRAVELAHADHGAIYLWDKATQLLTPRSWFGLGEWMAELRMQPGEGVVGTVAAARRGMILNDFRSSRYATPFWLEHTRHVAVLAEPLLYRTSLVGVISVNRNDPARPFRADDQRRLQLVAAQAAIAIANARLYEGLRGAAAELEARVEARTAELKEANRQIEAASQHKSEFLANMSHELRTPLNSILGFSQVLLERTADRLAPKERRFLTHIQTSGEHLLQLINDILDLSKVEAGRLVLNTELVAIPKLVEESLLIVRGLANKKELHLATAVPPDLPRVVVDPVRLKQILFNLLSNAVKFTPERGQVGVRVARIGDGNNATGDWLEVRVTDTGVGIRAEDLPRLFQDFVQLEATATKRHEGTGLGLALTKQLVELHGGRIWAESEGAGCGATFVVQLPFLEVPAPRILVVDDEAPFRRLLAMILGGAGYRVQVAEDAAEAVRAVEADPPALVVLDVGLPPDGAGGWTVLARLRSTPDLCAVPVLIVTGQDQIRAEEALARGATDFLGKPVSADVLEQTVERLLARAARLGDATGSGPPLRA